MTGAQGVVVVLMGLGNDARLAAKAEAKLADLPSASAITDPAQLDRKRAAIEAALARARAKRR